MRRLAAIAGCFFIILANALAEELPSVLTNGGGGYCTISSHEEANSRHLTCDAEEFSVLDLNHGIQVICTAGSVDLVYEHPISKEGFGISWSLTNVVANVRCETTRFTPTFAASREKRKAASFPKFAVAGQQVAWRYNNETGKVALCIYAQEDGDYFKPACVEAPD